MNMKRCLLLQGVILFMAFSSTASANDLQALQVSANGHYLQYADGTPFFYLGDTAWELFHRLDREEAEMYLDNRARKGYNVIQAVALSEVDGVDVPYTSDRP